MERRRDPLDLSTRLTVATVALVFVATAVVSVAAYLPMRESMQDSRLTQMRSDVRQGFDSLDALVREAEADVRVLIETPDSAAALADGDAEGTAQARYHLSRIFGAILTAKPDYTQIRLLRNDGNGREVVRLDRSGPDGAIRRVPDVELQPMGKRRYIRNTLSRPRGDIYVSPVELNREHGEIQLPYQPIMRVAMPVSSPDGAVDGVVVINIDLSRSLAQLRNIGGATGNIYLINTSGDFLLHPDPSREFGFEFGAPYRLQDEFPELGRLPDFHVDERTTIRTAVSDGDPAFAAAVGLLGAQIWTAVILTTPEAALLGASGSTLQLVVATSLAAIALAVVLTGLLARSVARPLTGLAHAIDQFDRGVAFDLPDRAPGELKLLSGAIRRHIERERRYSTAVESSTDAILLKDIDGNIVTWNGAAEELFGYQREEVIGKPLRLLVPDDLLEEYETILSTMQNGEATRIETVRLARNGSRLPVSLSVSPLRDIDGTVVGGCAISRDLTAQRQADILFRQAVDASPAAMIMMDHDGRIRLTSYEVREMFGYSGDELLGQRIEVLLPEQFRDSHPKLRREFLTQPTKRMMGTGRDLFGRHRDGSEFPVEVGLNPLHTAQGPMVLGVVVDITERKRTERMLEERTLELERSNAELEQFAYIASHDLQAPLRMVYGFCDLLKEQYRDRLDADGQEFIDFAVDGALRMRQMIDDLLDYSRVQTDRLPLEPVSAESALARALMYLTGAIKECDAEIRHGTLPVVLGNETQITRVFQNIVGNALKFRGAERPVIDITAEQHGQRWKFTISDNGIGFDAKQKQAIFGVFQRLHGRDEYPGTGIGLAICKRIVERHGGEIWAEDSTGPGATFRFTLLSSEPAADTSDSGKAELNPDGASGQASLPGQEMG